MPQAAPFTEDDLRAAMRLSGFDPEPSWERVRPPRRGAPPPGAAGLPPRPAGALAYVFRRDGRLLLPLTVRREDLPEHPGQVSLPGGRPHAGEDLWTTALREAREEIGLSSQGVERLGALAPVFIPVSHSVLCVHVALGRDPGALRPCPREVQSIALAGLDDLADPRCRRVVERQVGGRPVPVPTIQVAGVLLWGATAMALGELAARLASARDG